MTKVLMLLANGVEPLEMAAFTDVLGWASLLGDEKIELFDVGLRLQIDTTFGLRILPKYQLADINLEDFDALAIPGGFEPAGFYREAFSEKFLQVIRSFHDAGKPIASVCVSSLVLGEAGILTGRNATTYHQLGGKRKQQLLNTGANFVDKPLVVDGTIATSTGPGTAIEVALWLLTQLTDDEFVTSVREKMRIPRPSEQWCQRPQVKDA